MSDNRSPSQLSEDSPPEKSYVVKRVISYASIIILTTLVYWGNLTGDFIFDDIRGIVENESQRTLASSFAPGESQGLTTDGRPLLNFSFFLNYHFTGLDIRYYKAFNILLHAINGLLLFRLLNYFLLTEVHAEKSRLVHFLPLLVTLFWVSHPVHVNCISYVVQRAEILGAFAILTCLNYGIHVCDKVRGKTSLQWHSLILVLLIIIGSLAKEIVVAVPLILMLYDFLKYRRWRKDFHFSMIATFMLIVALHSFLAGRGASAGFKGLVNMFEYQITQTRAMRIYFMNWLYPTDIALDYGMSLRYTYLDISIALSMLITLATLIKYGWNRYPIAISLTITAACILLAPTTLVPIHTQTITIHRIYLASAFLTFGVLIALTTMSKHRLLMPVVFLVLVAICANVFKTRHRHQSFTRAETIWQENIRAAPDNPRGFLHLAYACSKTNPERSIDLYRDYKVKGGKGTAYSEAFFLNLQGRFHESNKEILKKYNLHDPLYFHINMLAKNNIELGYSESVIKMTSQLLRSKPHNLDAHLIRAKAYAKTKQYEKAENDLLKAIEICGNFKLRASAWHVWGEIHQSQKQWQRAIDKYTKAILVDKTHLASRLNRAICYQLSGSTDKAIADLNTIIDSHPDYKAARIQLSKIQIKN